MPQELDESELGTLEFWEADYQRQIANYGATSDHGQVWFGAQSVSAMVAWVDEHAPKHSKIVDIGCGNGHLVFALHSLGLGSKGIDYAAGAIELATQIARKEHPEMPTGTFEMVDILGLDYLNLLNSSPNGLFSLALDKGTFDAISLAPKDTDINPADLYVERVAQMLSTDGILLITSCNWTETELLARFGKRFHFLDRVKYPVFRFGGSTGQKVTTLALKKI